MDKTKSQPAMTDGNDTEFKSCENPDSITLIIACCAIGVELSRRLHMAKW